MRGETRLYTRGPPATSVGESRGEKRAQPEKPTQVTQAAPVSFVATNPPRPQTAEPSTANFPTAMVIAVLVGAIFILFVYRETDTLDVGL